MRRIQRKPDRRARRSGESGPPRSRFSPWRAASLIAVHLLIAAHIAHWLLSGRTLAPLELNEVMYTFELGIVTAGFLFMALALLATAIFGRFFCSWGCHILALQDLCAWLLRRVGIRPVPVRSRVLHWVPLLAALYMFVWPQVVRLWHGRSLPRLRLATDAEGWASFVTEEFWRNLPGPGVALLTFFIVGFLIVYVLGSRSFCRYGCPYGVVFALADRLAPGRIRLVGDCADCGICTAVCQSNIRVHEELARFGTVVNSACLKDLDCVSACTTNAVQYGFGRPSLLTARQADTPVRRIYDFSLAEECLAAAVFLITLVVYRGLYDCVPFLMTIGLGAVAAFAAVLCLRLARAEQVLFNRRALRRAGRLTWTGRAVVGACAAFALLTVHSAMIRVETHCGLSLARAALGDDGAVDASIARSASGHLERALRWGLWPDRRVEHTLVDMLRHGGDARAAERVLRRALAAGRGDAWCLRVLADLSAAGGRPDEAVYFGGESLRLEPAQPDLHYRLAGWVHQQGNPALTRHHLEQALRLRPDFAEAHFDLGAVLFELDDLAGGVAALRRALELRPDYADAEYNLAVGLAMMGKHVEAREHAARAAVLEPEDAQVRRLHALLQQQAQAKER